MKAILVIKLILPSKNDDKMLFEVVFVWFFLLLFFFFFFFFVAYNWQKMKEQGILKKTEKAIFSFLVPR